MVDMIFDKLAGIIERHYKMFKPWIKKTSLFDFTEAKLADEIKKDPNISWEFFLPFSTITLIHKNACLTLIDSEKDQVGFYKKRYYISFFPTKMSTQFVISYGEVIGSIADPKRFSIEPTLEQLVRKDKILIDDPGIYFSNENADLRFVVSSLVISSLKLIDSLNQPNNFIFEEKNSKMNMFRNKNKLARSKARPIYTILTPNQIHKRLGAETDYNDNISHLTSHPRRRHKRWLRDEKYRFDSKGELLEPQFCPKGKLYYKTSIIPATWVGIKEAVVGNKRYKVRLDL